MTQPVCYVFLQPKRIYAMAKYDDVISRAFQRDSKIIRYRVFLVRTIQNCFSVSVRMLNSHLPVEILNDYRRNEMKIPTFETVLLLQERLQLSTISRVEDTRECWRKIRCRSQNLHRYPMQRSEVPSDKNQVMNEGISS